MLNVSIIHKQVNEAFYVYRLASIDNDDIYWKSFEIICR